MHDLGWKEEDPWLLTLIGGLTQPVLLVDRHRTVRAANSSACALLDQEELAMAPVETVLRLHHRSRDEDLTEDVMQAMIRGTGVVLSDETEVERLDGTRLPVQGSALPVRDESGNVLGGVLILCKADSRSGDAQRLLQEYEAIFQSSHSPMFIVSVGKDGFRYRRVNRAREMTGGRSEAEVVGLTPRQVMGEELGAQIEERFRECAESGAEIAYIADRIYPAGRSVFQVMLTPLIVDGQVVEIIGSLHDITDLKVMEEILRESQERYQAVFDHARDGIILYPFVAQGSAARFSEVNPAYEELVGYDKDTLLNMTPFDLLESGQEKQVHFFRRELIQHGSCFFEFVLRSREGTRVPVGISARRIHLGEDEFVLAVVRDITERRKAEAAMTYRLSLEKAITEVSHLLIEPTLPDFARILAILGKGAEVSWAYFILVQDPDDESSVREILPERQIWEWSAPGESSLEEIIRDFPWESIAWLNTRLEAGEPVAVDDLLEMAPEADLEKHLLEKLGARSSLNVPVFFEAELMGVLGFLNRDEPRNWEREDVDLLTTVGRMIGTRIEQQVSQARVRYLSFHDQLTGLYNKAYFNEELRRLNTPRQLPISLIMGDVNGLKLVNDAFGHLEGDRLLRSVADAIRRMCRQEDIIARWGGDEFMVLLPRTDKDTAEQIGERIRRECERIEDVAIRVSMAVGSATKESPEQSLDDAMLAAEDQMYRHKIQDSAAAREIIMDSLRSKLVREGYEDPSHWERLHRLAEGFGSVLDLGVSEQEELNLLCYLHDIGKLAVPQEVIRKEELWTDMQKKQAEKHVEAGYRIALASPQLTAIAEDILSHHEHWDGCGYPRGLKGREIPYIARIFSLINAFEHLTQEFPYRQAQSEEEVLEYIRRETGKHFDPELAERFVRWRTSV